MDGLAYTVIGIIGSFSLLKMMAGKDGWFATVFLNIMFGGALFAMLNICNFIIPFNVDVFSPEPAKIIFSFWN